MVNNIIMCQFPNICVHIWLGLGVPMGTFVLGFAIPYLFLNRADREKLKIENEKLKKENLQLSINFSDDINKKFKTYKNKLTNYIKLAKTQKDTLDFTDLTDTFEDLLKSITSICETQLHGNLSDISFKKFKPTIKEICDYNMIQTYYGIIKLEFKKEDYPLIFEVYEKFCKNKP